MKKTLLLVLTYIVPAVAFGQYGLAKVGGEILLPQAEKALGERILQGTVTNGMRNATLRGMEIPALARQVASTAEANASALFTATSTDMLPAVQHISNNVDAAKWINSRFYGVGMPQVGYAMDSYTPKLQERYLETAQLGARDLPLPITSNELYLLAAADTEGIFFEIDREEDGVVVATFRKRMHVNVKPGDFMKWTNIGEFITIDKSDYATLQKTAQNMSPQAIEALKYRAGISYYQGPRRYLTADELRGLVSTGSEEFLGTPFLARVRDVNAPTDLMGVFVPVKKNLVVSSNRVFYSLPKGSYVAIDKFNGEIGQAHLVYDAGDLMIPVSQQMAEQLRELFSGVRTQKPISVMVEEKGTVPLTNPQ